MSYSEELKLENLNRNLSLFFIHNHASLTKTLILKVSIPSGSVIGG